jgi:iron complex transport system substrate-binding protein
MKKNIWLLIIILAGFMLSGCADKGTATMKGEITIEDGLGRRVVLEQPAEKIISMAPSNTEIIFAIGASDQLIGRDDFSDYPEMALSLPSIGGTLGVPNLEQVTSYKPDLVLVSPLTAPEQIKAMENLGLNIFYLDNPADFEGLFVNIRTVATLTGREAEAEELIKNLSSRVDAIDKVLENKASTPKIFYELDGTDQAKPWTTGPNTFISYLIRKAGASNVGDALTGDWVQISQEELLVQDPDIILLGDAKYGMTVEQVGERPGWSGLSAVTTGQVIPFDDDTVSRPGPRLVDGLESMARAFHPELFR